MLRSIINSLFGWHNGYCTIRTLNRESLALGSTGWCQSGFQTKDILPRIAEWILANKTSQESRERGRFSVLNNKELGEAIFNIDCAVDTDPDFYYFVGNNMVLFAIKKKQKTLSVPVTYSKLPMPDGTFKAIPNKNTYIEKLWRDYPPSNTYVSPKFLRSLA